MKYGSWKESKTNEFSIDNILKSKKVYRKICFFYYRENQHCVGLLDSSVSRTILDFGTKMILGLVGGEIEVQTSFTVLDTS